MKLWFLKLHRWIALVFAVPLVVILATGLILSFEPWLASGSAQPGSLTAEKIESLLRRHDPSGQARSISYRSYDGTLSIGAGRAGGPLVEVASGEPAARPSTLAAVLLTSRRLHETLLVGARWLVVASTVSMLALALLGVLMGAPRFANTLPGWHKGVAWGLLPLVVLSPLSALLMAAGITFAPAPSADAGLPAGAPTLAEAVRLVGREHDLSGLVWIRPQGGRMLARIVEDGEYRVYAVSGSGVVATPRNWPRLWHEGNFAGAWSALLNVVASLAMIVLLVTGPWLWLRRRRQRAEARRRRESAKLAAPAG